MSLALHAAFVATIISALRAWAGTLPQYGALTAAALLDPRGERWVVVADSLGCHLAIRLPYGAHGTLAAEWSSARQILQQASLASRLAEYAVDSLSLPADLADVARAIREATRDTDPLRGLVDPEALSLTCEALPDTHPAIRLRYTPAAINGTDLAWTLRAVYALDVRYRAGEPLTVIATDRGVRVEARHPEHGLLWVAEFRSYPSARAVVFDADAPAVIVCHTCGRCAGHAATEGAAMDLARAMRWVEFDHADGPRWHCPDDAPAVAPSPAAPPPRAPVGVATPAHEDPLSLARVSVRSPLARVSVQRDSGTVAKVRS